MSEHGVILFWSTGDRWKDIKLKFHCVPRVGEFIFVHEELNSMRVRVVKVEHELSGATDFVDPFHFVKVFVEEVI